MPPCPSCRLFGSTVHFCRGKNALGDAAQLVKQGNRVALDSLTQNQPISHAGHHTGKPILQRPHEARASGCAGTIERVLGSYLVAGDKVAVENPCFLSSINLLRTAGLQPLGVSVDAEGMCPDALEAALAKGASAVILTLRAHNLTGYSMSEKRARVLMRLLAKHPHLLLIVDDHFALLSNTAYYSVASAARVACT